MGPQHRHAEAESESVRSGNSKWSLPSGFASLADLPIPWRQPGLTLKLSLVKLVSLSVNSPGSFSFSPAALF